MSLLAAGVAALIVTAIVNPLAADAEVARTSAMVVPPPGGMTLGKAGNADLGQVVSESPFSVESVWAFDIREQRFVSHVPGAPGFVSTLPSGELSPDTLVWLKRSEGDRADLSHVSTPGSPAAGAPNALPAPSAGGLTAGVAGTNSVQSLLNAQPFQVASVWVFDVASQEYRVHIVGAPSFVGTLDLDAGIAPDTVVWLRRSPSDRTTVDHESTVRLATAAPSPAPAATAGSPAASGGPATTPTRSSTPTATPTATSTASPTAKPASTPTSNLASVPQARSGSSGCEAIPQERLNLLGERVGFGANATGGTDGCLYRVTNLNNSGLGSLREGASRGGRWIVFDVSGTISLSSPIDVASDTTIDGSGANITIRNNGLYVMEEQNVIISNLVLRTMEDDGIQIRRQSTKDVWVNRVTISDVYDGYIDITQGATNVTVSWSRFDPSPNQDREKAMLIGANDPGDRDDLSRVTLHHNYFNNTQQRNPLLRAGYVHSFNNYITGWDIYGSGVAEGGRLFSEGNVYQAGSSSRDRAFAPWDDGDAHIRSSGDHFMDGASGNETNASGVSAPPYSYRAQEAGNGLRDAVRNGAGAR